MKKRYFLIFLLVFIFVNFIAIHNLQVWAGGDSVSEYYKGNLRDDYYREGKALFNKAKYEEAILRFKEALRYDPEYELAIKYIQLAENKIAEIEKLEQHKILMRTGRKEELKKSQEIINNDRKFRRIIS
ncbi:MAG: hypothetical protein NC916_02055, partial [Candidatus Omnitrophica bacterium]|nr:hypothetical protein [Candidatus Omnitrophota bacterium]